MSKRNNLVLRKKDKKRFLRKIWPISKLKTDNVNDDVYSQQLIQNTTNFIE